MGELSALYDLYQDFCGKCCCDMCRLRVTMYYADETARASCRH